MILLAKQYYNLGLHWLRHYRPSVHWLRSKIIWDSIWPTYGITGARFDCAPRFEDCSACEFFLFFALCVPPPASPPPLKTSLLLLTCSIPSVSGRLYRLHGQRDTLLLCSSAWRGRGVFRHCKRCVAHRTNICFGIFLFCFIECPCLMDFRAYARYL